MAFRQVARRPEVFRVDWGTQFRVLPWTEDKTDDIADFLMATGTGYFMEIPECSDGTKESARLYVTRAREHVTEELRGDEVGYAASSPAYSFALSSRIGC